MQIRCSGCHSVLNVGMAGGQFQCPRCLTVNLVAAPVASPPQMVPSVPPAQPMTPPVGHHPQRPPAVAKKSDNRSAVVVAAFVVLGMLSMLVGRWGVGLGVLLLAWTVAAAVGKVKGPMELLYPESIGKTALAAAGIGLASFVTMCGAMGGVAQLEQERREAERVTQAEADRVAREEQEAADALARATKEKELRDAAPKVAKSFASGLDAVTDVYNEEQYKEAAKKLDEVAALTNDYGSLDPVPTEIAELVPRYNELKTKVDAAVAVVDAAANLDANIDKATELTDGTMDGPTWKAAKGVWETALANIVTLEGADERFSPSFPKDSRERGKTSRSSSGRRSAS